MQDFGQKADSLGWSASKYNHHSTESFTLGTVNIENEHFFSAQGTLCSTRSCFAAFSRLCMYLQQYTCCVAGIKESSQLIFTTSSLHASETDSS